MSATCNKNEGTVAVNSTNGNRNSTGDGQTIALPAGLLVNTGDCLEIEAVCVTSGLSGTVDLIFGGTTLATSGALVTTTATIQFTGTVIRTGATTQIAMGCCYYAAGGSSPAYSTPAETLANSITLKTAVASLTAGSLDFRILKCRVGRAS